MSVTLVTGGAGFIGSHLVDGLLAAGERVRVLDSLDPLAHATGRAEHLSRDAELMVGDLRDRTAVAAALKGADRVYHLGGAVGNGESMLRVSAAVDVNCVGTATLLEAVIERRDRIRRVVVASSMVVYGEGAYRCPDHGPATAPVRTPARLAAQRWEPPCPACGRDLQPVATTEDTPLAPASVYGVTKRDQEELALVLGRAYAVPTVALRYLNTYGPRQALANPYTGVAAIFAAQLLSGRRPRVFEDGGQLRDPVHVSDVVRATRSAMEAPAAPGHAINVGAGGSIRIADLARRLAAALGTTLEPEITGESRAGDIRHCHADVARARELLGFEAAVDLDTGLPGLCEWVAGQRVEERGDEAVAELRAHGLVG